MNSTNPIFSSLEKNKYINESFGKTATKQGIATKTLVLLMVTLLSGFTSIYVPENILMGLLVISGITSFIVVMIAMMKPKTAMPLSFVYAIGQGLVYGLITYVIDDFAPGAALTALIGTGAIFVVMLMLYQSGLLRGSALLRSVVLGSLIAILVGGLILTIVTLVNPAYSNSLFANPSLMIGLLIFMIVLGAFMLTLDFERAESIVAGGLPKEYEWQAALGFMITLIYIYFNILKLAYYIFARRD